MHELTNQLKRILSNGKINTIDEYNLFINKSNEIIKDTMIIIQDVTYTDARIQLNNGFAKISVLNKNEEFQPQTIRFYDLDGNETYNFIKYQNSTF